MIDFQNRGWKILAKLEQLAGFWPYQSRIKNYVVRIGISLLFLSYCVPLIIRMVKEWNSNFYIVLENSLILGVIFSIQIKVLITSLFQQQRRKFLEQVALNFETIVVKEEKDILNNYSSKALRLTTAYIGIAFICSGIYDGSPVARMYFNYFSGEGILEKKYPLYLDYLVDEQEYFYYILAHMFISLGFGMIAEFSYETTFFFSTRHACALFEIVKLRLKKALEIFEQCDQDNKVADSDEKEVFNIISSAVVLHNEALQLARCLDQAYSFGWFIILFLNTILLGPTVLEVLFHMGDLFQFCRYSLALIMLLIHFYVIFMQGQLIIDHSSSVFMACYDSNWYITPKRMKMSIAMVMINSLTPCQITGGKMFVLSMETYGKMLKTGLSFISIFAAFEY